MSYFLSFTNNTDTLILFFSILFGTKIHYHRCGVWNRTIHTNHSWSLFRRQHQSCQFSTEYDTTMCVHPFCQHFQRVVYDLLHQQGCFGSGDNCWVVCIAHYVVTLRAVQAHEADAKYVSQQWSDYRTLRETCCYISGILGASPSAVFHIVSLPSWWDTTACRLFQRFGCLMSNGEALTLQLSSCMKTDLSNV